jgi:hypothetical protein
MVKSAIKLRARCAKTLFVFIINLSEQRPFAGAVEILLAPAGRPSLDTLAMSVPLPSQAPAHEKSSKTAVFSGYAQTPAATPAGCLDEVREEACISHHIV